MNEYVYVYVYMWNVCVYVGKLYYLCIGAYMCVQVCMRISQRVWVWACVRASAIACVCVRVCVVHTERINKGCAVDFCNWSRLK